MAGIANLQSGFVLAVLIGAVLLAERLGGDDHLARRASQVVLAVVLALSVLSGTTAFLRAPSVPGGNVIEFSSSSNSSQADERQGYLTEAAHRTSEAGSIHIAFGIALAAVGGALFRRLRALPPALLLGGILLVLLGAPSSGATDIASLYSSVLPGSETLAGQARDIVRFAVLVVGAGLLVTFVYLRWERPESEPDTTNAAPTPQPET